MAEPSDIIVRVRHIRSSNVCMRGARQWFADHDLSWADFIENGLPISVADEMDDAFAKQVAEAARREVADADISG